MKISLIQPEIIWEDKLKNLNRLGHLISEAPTDTDIVLLPEMFTTGFSMNPAELAESTSSETLEWMIDLSKKYSFGICGSYIIKEESKFFNRWVFVSPDDEIWSYDKRHLFRMSGEEKLFTRGTRRIVFSFRGTRICPNICYDLRFPVWTRNRNDYDLLINAANWPESRRDVWLTLLKARAIENQCYVAGVNRIGIDGRDIKYCGDSIIIGPKGETVASAGSNKECLITAFISLAELSDFRTNFPVLNDADDFTIES